jgi:hypothetical protein
LGSLYRAFEFVIVWAQLPQWAICEQRKRFGPGDLQVKPVVLPDRRRNHSSAADV